MFITFEGIDGSGKTTQCKLLFDYLTSIGKKVVLTKEPGGGSKFSMDIRNLLSQSDSLLLSELLAIYAARNEHIEKFIKPHLNDGYIVICDRFVHSSIACYAEDITNITIAKEKVFKLNSIIDYLSPDLTFYMKISAEESLKRIKKRGIMDKYDNASFQKIKSMIEIYDYLSNEDDKVLEIDAQLTEIEVFKNIINYLQNNKPF